MLFFFLFEIKLQLLFLSDAAIISEQISSFPSLQGLSYNVELVLIFFWNSSSELWLYLNASEFDSYSPASCSEFSSRQHIFGSSEDVDSAFTNFPIHRHSRFAFL